MFPNLRERSTVQKEQMISLAWWEIGGSAGKAIGFSTILSRQLGTAHRETARPLTVCKSREDSGAKMEGIL